LGLASADVISAFKPNAELTQSALYINHYALLFCPS
jgi:hypothetical protein